MRFFISIYYHQLRNNYDNFHENTNFCVNIAIGVSNKLDIIVFY